MGSGSTAVGTQAIREPTNRWWRVLQWVGVVYALFAIWLDVDWSLTQARITSHGDYGMLLVASQLSPPGTARIVSLRSDGPAARAGLREGDQVALSDRWQWVRSSAPGEVLALRNGTETVKLTAVSGFQSLQSGDRVAVLISVLACIPGALLSLFILLRSGGKPAPVILGIALAAFGVGLLLPLPPTLSWPPTAPILATLTMSTPVIQTGAFLYLGVWFLRTAAGLHRRWLDLIPLTWTALYLPFVATTIFGWAGLVSGREPVFTLAWVGMWGRFIFDAAACVLLVVAWARSAGNERKRLTFLMIALGCLSLFQTTIDFGSIIYPDDWTQSINQWWYFVADVLAGVIAPVLFAYAILKDRIMDIGFAVNRTLVYSLVSAILLGAFGLIEWGVDHFLKIEGREKNALIDAAVALGVFLTFHRVRDFVERTVEVLFFRSWQEKEAKLRRYVTEAAFVTEPDALLTSLCGALSKFADGAETAIYLAERGTGFGRVAGQIAGVPADLGENDPALVTLRADRKPVDLRDTGTTIAAALCAPMTYGSEVRGLVLFGPKPKAADYRSDEIELIGWATAQVGLDLHGLSVRKLEANEINLRATVAALERALSLRPATA